MSFPVVYLGTLAVAFVLDQAHLLHSSGTSAWATFPAYETVANFQAPESSLRVVGVSFFLVLPL